MTLDECRQFQALLVSYQEAEIEEAENKIRDSKRRLAEAKIDLSTFEKLVSEGVEPEVAMKAVSQARADAEIERIQRNFRGP